jgi:3-deoxy-manno-octulosonate cytidylyltransferase (CMP-KDO synthetase)
MVKKAFIGIIPARYGSTRFPGKPLAIIGGKPMIQRVYEQAKKALETVVVATDDERIFDCVRGFGGEAVMTRSDHKCGTERCCEAVSLLTAKRSHSEAVSQQRGLIIINIQGDEPFIQPEQIEALKGCFADESTQIATLVKPFTEADSLADLENPNTPKVAVAFDKTDGNGQVPEMGRALLFSRSVIPYVRGVDKSEWLEKGRFYRHIGMYAYRADVLREIVQLEQTPLEKAESLEQLRWLENGYTIKAAVCETASIGIDTPEDLKKASAFFKKFEDSKI